MAIHSSILAWRIPMDRGAWQANVHGVARLSDYAHTHIIIHLCLRGEKNSVPYYQMQPGICDPKQKNSHCFTIQDTQFLEHLQGQVIYYLWRLPTSVWFFIVP